MLCPVLPKPVFNCSGNNLRKFRAWLESLDFVLFPDSRSNHHSTQPKRWGWQRSFSQVLTGLPLLISLPIPHLPTTSTGRNCWRELMSSAGLLLVANHYLWSQFSVFFLLFLWGKQWFFSLFLCPLPPHIISLCTCQGNNIHLKSSFWQREEVILNSQCDIRGICHLQDKVHIPKHTWLVFISPALSRADPRDKSQTKLFMSLKKRPVISHCQVFNHTSMGPALTTASHIIYLMMSYSFLKSQPCGLRCECFPKPPIKCSSPSLCVCSLLLLYHYIEILYISFLTMSCIPNYVLFSYPESTTARLS